MGPGSRGARGGRRWWRRALPALIVPVALGALIGTGLATVKRYGRATTDDPVAFAETALSAPKVRTVVLDPGHGGRRSPGSVGPNGLVEGDLTLDIARRLDALLRSHGFSVFMTRDEDRPVSLERRAAMANEVGGDIFVSIHINSLRDDDRGIETFFFGPVEARWLDDRDADGEEGSLVDLRRPSRVADASPRLRESRLLAEAVHRDLDWYLAQVEPSMGERGIKTAPFVVLMLTEMPAILAEVSTLSHPDDAELLELEAYREYIALALFNGIRAYSEG